MGHDYLDLGDGHVRLNDFHIEVLGHLFLHCASTSSPDSLGTDPDTHVALEEFFAKWQCHGPGVFEGTDFNAFATSPERYRVLQALFECTLEYLCTFDDEIPLAFLQNHFGNRGMTFTAGQPTSIYRDAIRSLINLIPSKC